LLDFEKSMEEFRMRDIRVIAASVDTVEYALETINRYKISFRVGYGLKAEEVSARTGAFYEKEKGYIHATGYIVNPEGTVVNGVYSTQSVGRFVARDCLALIDYLKGETK
jgi:alkyl hydroperoxide reductase subunit AhpC